MRQTEHYQLSQWDAEDRILREDFNGDNAKVDAALHALAADAEQSGTEVKEALKVRGNCQIVYGSYVGTGNSDSNPPCTLTFDHKPLLLAVLPERNSGDSSKSLLAVRGSTFFYTYQEYFASENTVTWGEKSVSWHTATAAYQFNSKGVTYHYVALLGAET